MTTRGWLAILGATLVLGLAFHLHRRSESVARVRVAPQPMPAPIQKQIDYGDAYDTFLSKLAAAERIDDPLQRCLAMPDPPVSHWSHEVVDAYCRYSLHPPISRDEAHRLITTGRADELSRQLGELLQTQHAHGGATGELDSTLEQLVRLDADDRARWIRQSPNNAFTLLASGYAHLDRAGTARGSEFADKTSQKQFDAMAKELVLARADLMHALALEPNLAFAHRLLSEAALFDRPHEVAAGFARRGLAIEPANFALYGSLLRGASPEWGGSIGEMRSIVAEANVQAPRNPLLRLLAPDADAVAADLYSFKCSDEDLFAVWQILDHPATSNTLALAGTQVMPQDDALDLPDLCIESGAVYLSEALRFWPWREATRLRLARLLAEQGKSEIGLPEAERAVALSHGSIDALLVRGDIEESMEHYDLAIRDDRAALVLKPGDIEILASLGQVETRVHEWDAAWAISEKLVRRYPKRAEGWMLRGLIQEKQPRPGLRETERYFVEHFEADPNAMDAVAHALKDLTKDKKR